MVLESELAWSRTDPGKLNDSEEGMKSGDREQEVGSCKVAGWSIYLSISNQAFSTGSQHSPLSLRQERTALPSTPKLFGSVHFLCTSQYLAVPCELLPLLLRPRPLPSLSPHLCKPQKLTGKSHLLLICTIFYLGLS